MLLRLEQFRRELLQTHRDLVHYLAKGGSQDFEDYKHTTGRLEMLDQVMDGLEQLIKKIEQEEDQD